MLMVSCRLLLLRGRKGLVNFSVANTKLDAAGLNALFNSLGTTTGRTITITGCPGAGTCDRTIATAKGWTVSG